MTITNSGQMFSTERMRVEPWKRAFEGRELSAASGLAALLAPEVLKSLPEPLQTENTPENCQSWIDARLSESEVLAILEPSSNALIGVIILAEFETSDAGTDVHIGYLLSQSYWGKGLASEVIAGLVAHFAKAARPIRLLGGVEKTNPASARVLLKAGFARLPELSDEETEMFALVL